MALAPYSRQKKAAYQHYGVVLAVIALILIASVVIRLLYSGVPGVQTVTKDFLFEPGASVITESGKNQEPANVSIGTLPSGSVRYQVNTAMSCRIKDGTMDLMAANPAGNPYYLRVTVLSDNDEALLVTGLLKPGYQLMSATLSDIPEKGSYGVTVCFEAFEISTLELAGTVECQAELSVS